MSHGSRTFIVHAARIGNKGISADARLLQDSCAIAVRILRLWHVTADRKKNEHVENSMYDIEAAYDVMMVAQQPHETSKSLDRRCCTASARLISYLSFFRDLAKSGY